MDFSLTLFCWTLFWVKSIAIFVDPLLTLNEEIGEIKRMKRAPVRFTSEQKEAILNLHNEYRKTAVPTSADMRMLTWDSKAEISAQIWAEYCVFEHGMPSGYRNMGQNLYIGPDKEGLRATFLWWNETYDYNFWTGTCVEDAQCGHYTQMMWATSERLGCGVCACPSGNLIVCHYDPPGNVAGAAPYQVGTTCSQCYTDNGGKCFQGLCVSKKECQADGIRCTCPLTCHNCGELDENTCHCKCKDGWDSLDCSRKCEDAHDLCRKNPGYPNEDSCTRDIRIRQNLCRSMCHQCNVLPPGFPKMFYDPDITGESGGNYTRICMNGDVCSNGDILDPDFGVCRLLCPGPKCSGIRIRAITIPLVILNILLLLLFV